MNLIKPKKLAKGDKIIIIAPSGPVGESKINNAVKYFTQNGYKVKLGKHIFSNCDYLAGCDKNRLSDLHEAFEDKETNAIICARGGYGALRLIDKIDYELIQNNPKIFCGYSDITVLNAMILKHSNLLTFSGAMAQSDFAENINSYTEKEFFNTLGGNLTEITPTQLKTYKAGYAEGILFGGNLSTLASLCGRDFVPSTKFILFIEDLNEPVYKIDRYITQLLGQDGFVQNLTAIVLGDFLDVDNQNMFENYFSKLANELNIPIVGGYPISHAENKATIPYGINTKLENGVLKISHYLA